MSLLCYIVVIVLLLLCMVYVKICNLAVSSYIFVIFSGKVKGRVCYLVIFFF